MSPSFRSYLTESGKSFSKKQEIVTIPDTSFVSFILVRDIIVKGSLGLIISR